MENLQAGRALIGDTLGFHIIFALLGVGLPLMISIFEFIAIKTKNQKLRETVRLWSYIAVILVVVGVVSGTIVAVQLSLIWPGLFEFGGSSIGMAFSLEGYMFFIEAVFLAWYISTWKKLKGYKHWLLTLPIVFGSTGSAFMITAANSWMNNPSGFDYVDGKVINPEPWAALFNGALFYEFTHSVFAYYLATALIMLSCYAWVSLKKKKNDKIDKNKKLSDYIMVRLCIVSLICLVIVGIMGDQSAKYIAREEPRKFAAIEAVYNTSADASLNFGGIASSNGSVWGGVNIPYALSILAGGSPNTVVKGLNEYPKNLWPPLIVHSLFDIKMTLVPLLGIIPLAFLIFHKKWKRWAYSKLMLWSMVAAGFISVIVIELGWMLTELGRQPFIIVGYMLTSEAFTTSNNIIKLGFLFPLTYVFLFIFCGWAVIVTIKRFSFEVTK